MLPAHFSQIGGALKNFGLKFVLPVYSLSKLAQSAAATIRELSALTDRANDAGMAAPVLQKLVGAMQQVGVRAASIDTVAAAMQHMARTTGEVGAEGFAKVLGQAARLESEAERLDFLSRAFGRTNGAAFAALIRDGDAGIRKLIDLASGYPAVSDASAQAADAAADAMARATDAISSAPSRNSRKQSPTESSWPSSALATFSAHSALVCASSSNQSFGQSRSRSAPFRAFPGPFPTPTIHSATHSATPGATLETNTAK